MKKALVLLLALLMTFSAVGAMGVSAEDAEVTPKYEIIYNSQTVVDKVGLDGTNTGKAYDATENAMKIYVANNDNAPARFKVTYNYSANISADEYPVLAVKVKANDTKVYSASTKTKGTEAAKNAGALLGEGDSKVATYGVTNTKDKVSTISIENGYELLIINFWKASEIYGKKDSAIYPLISGQLVQETLVDLLPYSIGSNVYDENDYFLVKSAALFATENEAKEYYGAYIAPHYVFNLDTAENVAANSSIVTNGSAESFGYDSTEKALYVKPKTTAKEGGNVKLDLAGLNIEPTEYPHIAIKVKLKDSTSTFGQAACNTKASQTYKNSVGGSTYNITFTSAYEATNDWQIVKLNVNDAKLQTSTTDPLMNYPLTSHTVWNQVILQFSPYNAIATESEGYYIEWIGFFKNEGDAEMYESSRCYAWQKSAVTKVGGVDVYNTRIICTVDNNYEQYSSAGMIVTAKAASGTYQFHVPTNVVYGAVNEMTDKGLRVHSAPEGTKFMALVIAQIPVSEGDIEMTVTPYVEKGDARYYGRSSTFTVSSTATAPVE